MYLDSMSYSSDDILCKGDRAAMGTKLETRVPFLDQRVAERVWRLPLHLKIHGNQDKWALRQVLYKYMLSEIIDRPKVGFPMPIGQWIRGPLRDWAEALLDAQRLEREGYFYPVPICSKLTENLSGHRDCTPILCAVLMVQSWLEGTK